MYQRTSVIIATCDRPAKLANCLRALAQQQLPRGVVMEVIIAVDGADQTDEYVRMDQPRATKFLFLPRCGIGACRNAAIEQATGDLLITTNDDTTPQPNWVAEHLRAHDLRGEPGLVVGLTQWRRWTDATVFDGLVRDTSMIFFFDRMRAGEMYGFRHAWTCNISLPMSVVRTVGGYDERLWPYGFEDLEYAFRIEQRGHRGVYYHPAALNTHDHRITWKDYCNREACLGRMAACLWEVNPACFETVFHSLDGEKMRQNYTTWLEQDQGDHEAAAEEMNRWATRPLAEVSDWENVKRLLYRLHLPVKRRCFREGYVSGFDLRHDTNWRERLALGHSFP